MKPSLDKIKALVFDAYGTLLDVKSLDERLEYHYGDQAGRINSLWRQKQLQYTWLRSIMDRYKLFSQITREALEFACKDVGVDLTDEIIADLMDHYFILSSFPEVPELLKELSQSLACSILSNADMPMLQKACDHNGISQYLEAILTVDSVGINKPAPQVYELATRHFHCEGNQIAFISSNTWDVAGAKSFGLKSIWLNRTNGTMETLGFEPDWTIESLSDLI